MFCIYSNSWAPPHIVLFYETVGQSRAGIEKKGGVEDNKLKGGGGGTVIRAANVPAEHLEFCSGADANQVCTLAGRTTHL